MTRTRILLFLLAMVVLMQLFPDRAGTIEVVAVTGGGLCCLAWAANRFLARRRLEAANAAQAAADEEEYRHYKSALDMLRATHEPLRDWNDPTSITPEYQGALAALHDKHEAMLTRKFGRR